MSAQTETNTPSQSSNNVLIGYHAYFGVSHSSDEEIVNEGIYEACNENCAGDEQDLDTIHDPWMDIQLPISWYIDNTDNEQNAQSPYDEYIGLTVGPQLEAPISAAQQSHDTTEKQSCKMQINTFVNPTRDTDWSAVNGNINKKGIASNYIFVSNIKHAQWITEVETSFGDTGLPLIRICHTNWIKVIKVESKDVYNGLLMRCRSNMIIVRGFCCKEREIPTDIEGLINKYAANFEVLEMNIDFADILDSISENDKKLMMTFREKWCTRLRIIG